MAAPSAVSPQVKSPARRACLQDEIVVENLPYFNSLSSLSTLEISSLFSV